MSDDKLSAALAEIRTTLEGDAGYRLLAAVEAVLSHHCSVQLYGTVEDYRGNVTCGHGADYDGDAHFEGDDGLWYCKAKPTVTVCAACCDESDSDLRAKWPCPTYEAILTALTGKGRDDGKSH